MMELFVITYPQYRLQVRPEYALYLTVTMK